MQIDPTQLDRAAAYHLMTSVILPRPIAWIGSIRADGTDNLAPFSYFMGVASNPPLLAVSVARGPGGALKDTARALLETGELTVSIPEEADLDAMHRSAAPFTESEFDAVPVARAPSVKVRAPRPASSRVSMECTVSHTLDLGQTHLFVCTVVWFHVDDAVYRDGVVDIHGLRPVARLGGALYTTLGTLLTRPPARL